MPADYAPADVTPFDTAQTIQHLTREMLGVLVVENLLHEDAVDLAIERLLTYRFLYQVGVFYAGTEQLKAHSHYPVTLIFGRQAAQRWGAEVALEYYQKERLHLPELIAAAPGAPFFDRVSCVSAFRRADYGSVIRRFNDSNFGVRIEMIPVEPGQICSRFYPEPSTLLTSFLHGSVLPDDEDEEVPAKP